MTDPVQSRIVVADDHPMCRVAVRLAAEAVGFFDIVDVASLAELLRYGNGAALIVLDLGLPDSKGIGSLIDVIREYPQSPVLVVSGNKAADIEQRVEAAGAAGFVSKLQDLTDLGAAIAKTATGERYFSYARNGAPALSPGDLGTRLQSLTPAEARILREMGDGRMNKQIAYDLGVSAITVKQHITAILRKLGVHNRTQAILLRQQIEEL